MNLGDIVVRNGFNFGDSHVVSTSFPFLFTTDMALSKVTLRDFRPRKSHAR